MPSDATVDDRRYMARAIQLARKGLYTTTPNPRVGCVIVKNDEIISEGWHEKTGEAHAEVVAMQNAKQLGIDVTGATAFVTLEPCSHTGKTGPCSEALIAAGIGCVVFGMRDPNPQVAGKGLAKLEAAGIKINGPLLEGEARLLNPGFIKRMETGLPWVRVKLAMSLDGRTAMASGESKWITGPQARADVQRLRAQSCAVMTGINTVLQDHAQLTVRAEDLRIANAEKIAQRQPLRVVLDSKAQLNGDAMMLQSGGQILWLTQSAASLDSPKVENIALDRTEQGFDLREVLKLLADRQCNEILVEAGATLAGQFVEQGLVDELIIYMAPKLLGSTARPLLHLPIANMASQLPLTISDMRVIGEDWRITARLDLED